MIWILMVIVVGALYAFAVFVFDLIDHALALWRDPSPEMPGWSSRQEWTD